MKRREIVEKRTANRKFYENQDHSVTAEIYLDNVHYQETDGSWKEMDDSLSEEAPEPEDVLPEMGVEEGYFQEKDLVNHKGELSIRLKKKSNPQGHIIMKKRKQESPGGLKTVEK